MTVSTGEAPLDGPAILANARAVAPILSEEADAGEQGRRLTPRAVDALRRSGAFRMPMPRAWGGPEMDICMQLEVVEELSRADGSAGWCVMIGSDSGFYSAALDDAVGRALYPDLDAVTAGWILPGGRLDEVDGGYLLSGRWQFGSGCTHADVIAGGAVIHRDGEPVRAGDGTPEARVALMPAEQVEILDTWNVTGLAGSGSHDYTTAGTFVPAEHTFSFATPWRRPGTLYTWPGMFINNLPGVPLGIAQAALDAAEEILADKVIFPEGRPARDEPRVRAGVTRAQAMVGSARSYVFDVMGDLWAALDAGTEPSRRQRAAVGGAHAHTVRACREAVDLLADLVGSASIRRGCPLERHRRDLATISQHILAQPRLTEVIGALWIAGAATDDLFVAQRII